MSHDQLFKDLLHVYLAQLMRLFFPRMAARLDFSAVQFLEQEAFTARPRGKRRTVDIVAQVGTKRGKSELLLIHIEIERTRRRTFSRRVFEYYMLLRLKYGLRVLPIVIYLSGRAGGVTTEQHVDRVFEKKVCTLEYDVIALADLRAEEYLSRNEPLAGALSALMQPAELKAVERKIEALRQVAVGERDEGNRLLLAEVVERYIRLTPAEEQEFAQKAKQEPEVAVFISTYERRGIEIGRAEGRVEGRVEGRAEGRVEGEQRTLLRQLARKFGPLPEWVAPAIAAIDDQVELDRLADQLLDAHSLEQLQIPPQRNL